MKKLVLFVCVVIYLGAVGSCVFKMCKKPVIEQFGSSYAVYSEAEDEYKLLIAGEWLPIKAIKRGKQTTLHDGMEIFYIKVSGVKDLYFSSDEENQIEWGKNILRARYGEVLFILFMIAAAVFVGVIMENKE